jgi:hypothetical protein
MVNMVRWNMEKRVVRKVVSKAAKVGGNTKKITTEKDL